MTEDVGKGYGSYLQAARVSQSGSIHPTVTGLISIGIVMDCLLLIIWGYVGYMTLIEDGPIFQQPPEYLVEDSVVGVMSQSVSDAGEEAVAGRLLPESAGVSCSSVMA